MPGRAAAIEPRDELDAKLGPKMLALPSDRHRKFVMALFVVKPGHGSAVRAARAAGFGTDNSKPQTMASIAHRLTHDERVIEAIREYSEGMLRFSSPAAIQALQKLVADPKHKDHARGIAMVLDRNHPVETIQTLKHHVTPEFRDTAEVMRRIAELAAKFNVLPAPVVIDAHANEVGHAGD